MKPTLVTTLLFIVALASSKAFAENPAEAINRCARQPLDFCTDEPDCELTYNGKQNKAYTSTTHS